MNEKERGYITTRPTNQVTRQGRGIRKKSADIDLIKLGPLLTVASSISRDVYVATPSSKVNVTVEIFFDADQDLELTAGPNYNSGWLLLAYAKGINRALNRMHIVYPAVGFTALPEAYEYSTGVEFARVVTLLGSPTIGATVIPGTWYLRATWENTQELPDEELDQIFNNCYIRSANYTQTNNFRP